MANFSMTFAHWRTYYGKDKYFLANFILEIRQVVNVVGKFATGECTIGEIPNWQTYREPAECTTRLMMKNPFQDVHDYKAKNRINRVTKIYGDGD